MSNIDLTPLYRTMVGFDRMASMIDQASRLDGSQGYPPYNIERVDENAFATYTALEVAASGIAPAQAQAIDGIFGRYPDYRWNGSQESALRAELYGALLPIVGPGKMVATANALLRLERV